METRNYLKWCPTKDIRIDGRNCTIKVKVSLDDECKNKHCDFSITSMIYLKNPKHNEDPCVGGGCNHEEIGKYFPELKKFFPLHICAHEGTPLYPESNGSYILKKDGKDAAKKYLRCTDEEIEKLSVCGDDKLFFKYQLYALGIVDRWKREADEFIAFLEEKCGYKWLNPYTPEEERFRMVLTDEEKSLVEERIKSLYYSVEQINARKLKKFTEEKEKAIAEINAEYEKSTENARMKRDVMIYILECGFSLKNIIYYDHSKTVCFNWRESEDLIPQEEFVDFVNNIDHTKVSDKIKFEIKYQKNN